MKKIRKYLYPFSDKFKFGTQNDALILANIPLVRNNPVQVNCNHFVKKNLQNYLIKLKKVKIIFVQEVVMLHLIIKLELEVKKQIIKQDQLYKKVIIVLCYMRNYY